MAASDRALDLRAAEHDEHRVAAAVVSDDSFELACTCGWSTASPSGVDILDAWADHCISVGPGAVVDPDVSRRLVSRRRMGE